MFAFERRDRYLVARWVDLFGEEFPITDFGGEIVVCPKREPAVTTATNKEQP
jgi:hypothetical protein